MTNSYISVEVKKLRWELEGLGLWEAKTSVGSYTIVQNSAGCFSSFYGAKNISPTMGYPTLEATQAFCQADHERRTRELVNARSVESVERDYLERLIAEADKQADDPAKSGTPALSAYRWLRSLTEGEE